nr:MAG TPA: hypothetical protein [Caudoviricetes sp.]
MVAPLPSIVILPLQFILHTGKLPVGYNSLKSQTLG